MGGEQEHCTAVQRWQGPGQRYAEQLWTALFSILVAQVAFFHFTDAFAAPVGRVIASLFLLHLTAFLVLGWPVRQLHRMMAPVRSRARALGIAVFVVAGLLATWAIPVPIAPQSQATLRIVATGGKADAASSSEVWVRMEVDGRRIGPDEFTQRGWQTSGEFMLSTPGNQPASLQWRGSVGENVRLVFVSHPWSGKAHIEWNGAGRDVDLYSSQPGGSLDLALMGAPASDDALVYPERNLLQRWVQLLDGLLIGLLLAAICVYAVTRGDARLPAAKSSANMGREILLHAFPTLAIGLFLLMVYFPALMTSDSLDQWRQAGSGQYNDAHPLVYAFLIRALRAILDSPAIVAGAQLVAMATASGWLIAVTRRALGARLAIAHIGAWLLALHPIVALTNITIWKDVPYTVSVVVLTAYLVGVLFLDRPRLDRPLALAGLVVAVVACMSLRHNGPPVALAVLALLWLARNTMRRQVVLAAVLALASFGVLKGPVADWVGSTRANAAYALYSHHIGAFLTRNLRPASEEDKALLAQLDKTDSDWRYNCATVNPTIFNPNFDAYQASINGSRLLSIWTELVLAHPDIEAAHVLCASGLVWRMTESERDPLYLAGVAIWAPQGRVRWIVGKPGDPVEHSLAPSSAERIGRALLKLDNDILWRPAGFLYLLLFAVAVAWRRQADWRWLLVAATCLVHSAVLALATVAQDARYQLPVYVISLALVPLLLMGPRRPGRGPAEARTA